MSTDTQKQAFLLLGAPGSGKGTQGRILCTRRSGIKFFSIGEALRQHVQNSTPLGERIQENLKQGRLVDANSILEVLVKFLNASQSPYVLIDGFPRNLEQCACFEQWLLKDRSVRVGGVFYLAIEDEVALERLEKRYVCRGCESVYARDVYEPEDGICQQCGSQEFFCRKDDQHAQSVARRLNTHKADIQALLDVYRHRGCLHVFQAEQDRGVLAQEILDTFDQITIESKGIVGEK